MSTSSEQFFPFHPSKADCDDRAKYWREVAADPRSNEATRVVARKQELAWLTIGMNIDDLNRAETDHEQAISTGFFFINT